MRHSKAKQGFTLIELMIVLAIVGSAIALVGPNLFKAYDNTQRRAEQKDLDDLLQAISYKAFINNRAVEIRFSDNTIRYGYQDTNKRITLTFEWLTFPNQQIRVSEYGYPNSLGVRIVAQGEETILSFSQLGIPG